MDKWTNAAPRRCPWGAMWGTEKWRAREGEDSVTERKGECLQMEFVQVPICKRERDSWNGRRDRREYKTVVWTKNYKKGFNKKWISTNLKVLGGENDLTHSQSVTHRHSNCCPTERPRLGPGHTAPPLREGPHMTRTGPANSQPPLTFADIISISFSPSSSPVFCWPFFLLIPFFFFFEFLGPDGTLWSKEVWVVIVYDVTVVLVAQRKFFLFQSQQFPPFLILLFSSLIFLNDIKETCL